MFFSYVFHCWLFPLAVMSFFVCLVSTLHGSPATASFFLEHFSLIKTTWRIRILFILKLSGEILCFSYFLLGY